MITQKVLQIAALVVPLIHLMGLLSAIRAIMESRTAQGAIAWAVSLITFPYLAVPLFWVFGRYRFQGYLETLRSNRFQESENIPAIRADLQSFAPAFSQPESDRFQVLERLAWFPFSGKNSTEILVDGKATFDSIFEAMEQAHRYVLIQFFIVHDDDIGRALKELIKRRVLDGIKVYFLYDEIGSHDLPNRYVRDLSNAGAEIRSFQTTRGKSNRFQLNFRNHRKIVVVDGRVGFIGGHNVGDEYLGHSRKFKHWRDTHLKIIGPAVQSLQAVFMADWYWANRNAPALEWTPEPASSGDKRILILPTGPADSFETCTLLFVQAIQSARRRIWIASPYFVPNSPVFEALRLAALRGVDVRIMLPSKPDHILAFLAAKSYLPDTDRAGIKVLRYRKGFMHQKVMVIDDDAAAIGTANLDNRSLRLNFEVTAFVVDREFAAEAAAMMERDFELCRATGAGEYDDRSFWYRVMVRTARLFDPIL
ncbi:MAG: cardiolipin synthase [Candidatus Sumerlaeaceae bacterium]|nr:cardiolipin synthase [Candidatus Sumerlaeaceae bacterium]